MADGSSKRLVITDEDLAAAPPSSPPPASPGNGFPAATPFPAAGPPPAAYAQAAQKKKLGDMTAGEVLEQVRNQNTLVTSVIAASVAGLIAWALFELVQGNSTHLVREAAWEFGLFTAVFAAIYAAWDDITAGLWENAGRAAGIGFVIGAVAGAVSGAIAQKLYGDLIESLIRSNGFFISQTDIRLDLIRALGWGLLGLGIGAATGAARQSGRKAVNGLIGGALGGAAGGFLFNFIGKATSSEVASRFFAFAVAGVLIGIAIGLIEVARRQAWIKVIAGGMSGKEFILYHPQTNFGSSPKCEITLLKDRAVGPYHFRIDERGNRRALTAYENCAVTINGSPVASHWLQTGDVIGVGTTALRYQERAVA